MVSDVDAMLAETAAEAGPEEGSSRGAEAPLDFDAVGVASDRRDESAKEGESGASWGGFGWAAVIVLVWVIIAIIGSATGESQPPSAPSASTTSPPESRTTPQGSAAGSDAGATQPPSSPPIESRPPRLQEVRPPVATDHVLTPEQIRYCLAESIRINAAEPLVDAYSQADVDYFHEIVDDYNRRCGEYRYWEGDLQRARSDVAPHRARIEEEGRRWFSGGS